MLLFAHGLGTGDGGPWRRRLGDALDSPAQMLRHQLRWAVTWDRRDRVRLLIAHGVDVVTPASPGERPPAGLAAPRGHREVVAMLVAAGAAPPERDLGPSDAFLAAAMAGDRVGVDRLCAAHPGLLDRMQAEQPHLVALAAEVRRPEAVRLVAGLGFDVDALAGETALHRAVHRDGPEVVRLLLELGADPTIEDRRFHATPLGWAQHFGNGPLIELLEAAGAAPPGAGEG